MGTSHDTSRSRRVLPFSPKSSPQAHTGSLYSAGVQVPFKTAAALDSSSPKWWQALELKQPMQALHRCQLLPPPAGTSLSRLLPPGLGLGVTAELGLPNRPTAAGALAQLRPGQRLTVGTALQLRGCEGLLRSLSSLPLQTMLVEYVCAWASVC